MIRRTLSFVLSVLLLFILSRALIRALPGDPLDSLLAETAIAIPREQIAADLGLELPFWKSCLRDLSNLFHGNLGYSLMSREPVGQLLSTRWLRTVSLAFGALSTALLMAIPAGLYCAIPHATKVGRIAASFLRLTFTLSISLPLAWVGPAALYLFSISLRWAEFRGSYFLACFILALPLSGNWQRLIELRVREEMAQPFFRAALSRGHPLWRCLLKDALAPAGGALLAILGSQAGSLLAGAFLVEWIFDWPGMGMAWIHATLQRDYPVMEAAAWIGSSTCLAGILFGDWLQSRWDPRTREGQAP